MLKVLEFLLPFLKLFSNSKFRDRIGAEFQQWYVPQTFSCLVGEVVSTMLVHPD
jgi:hypothetical protein